MQVVWLVMDEHHSLQNLPYIMGFFVYALDVQHKGHNLIIATSVRCKLEYERKCPPDVMPFWSVYTVWLTPGGLNAKLNGSELYQ